MANTDQKSATAPKRGWLKKIGILAGALLVLLVVAWLIVTSDSFFKGTILPRVGKAMNATLTADTASISPFSQVTLKGVKLQTTGTEPLLTVAEVRARYSLMAILGGTLKIDEVLIDSPVLTVIENADGTLNTTPLVQGGNAETKSSTASSKPPQVDLKNFTLKNATARYIKHHAGGTRDTAELTGFNVTLDDVKNGAAGKFAFEVAAKADLNPPDAAKRGTLAAKHEGKYTFTLGPDLMPTQITGSDKTDVTTATGALADLANTGVDLVADMSPTDIKGIVITFRKGGASLGELRLSGPFDSLKREGKLTLAITGIDRKLLNLGGTMTGMDFGSTSINSTSTIELSKSGALINIAGRLGIADLQVTRERQTTPTLQFNTDYALTVDGDKSSATLRTLNLNGTQNGRTLLKSELSSPMTFAWGSSAGAVGDASLALALTDLNLADWKPFLGGAVAGGKINATVKLLSQEAGMKLGIEMASEIQNLSTDASRPDTLSTKTHLKATLSSKDDTMNIAGKFTVDEIVSRSGAKELRVPASTVDFNVTKAAEVIELKQCLAKLAPTARAQNELSLAGRVDMTKPDAITGGFKLTADALDLTAYYDLLSGDPAAKPATKSEPAPAPATTEKEPDAMTLPFRNFTCDVNLARVYLREVDIENLQASAKLDGAQVSVKPVLLSLNGAPIKGSLEANLGVPGFQYEFTFDAPNVPLEPLVNTFVPDRKGQIHGTATASANFKGAGITGAGLQKNLTGQFDLVATNLNLALSEVRTPVFKSLINVVVGIPDMIRNPEAALGNLAGRLLGAKKEGGGGITDEFTKSPINGIVARGTAGGGKIELKQAFVESSAFRGDAAGTIEIAGVMTNSVMSFPVSVSLAKGISDKIGLTPENTASNAVYVALPDFVKMGGTLGVPKPDVKYLVLAKLALKSGGGILGNTGGATKDQVGNIVGAVGGLLGNKPATTSTNLTTNAAPAADLIRGLGGLLGGKKKPAQTNPPVEPKP